MRRKSEVWSLARESLTCEEHALVGDEIDEILCRQKAPAEEQLAFLADVPNSASDATWNAALTRLIERYTVRTELAPRELAPALFARSSV